MSPRKSKRQSHTADQDSDSTAEYPLFTLAAGLKEAKSEKQKRRRTGVSNEENIRIQSSPLSPSGKFCTYKTVDMHYRIEPSRQWTSMAGFNNLVRKCLYAGAHE